MKQKLLRGLIAVLLCGVAFFGWRTARAAAAFTRAPGLVEVVTGEGERGFRPAYPRGAAAGALPETAGPGRVVVFVYSPECGACNDNMWNWVDMVRRGKDGPVRFHALGVTPDSGAVDYWGGLARVVRVAQVDPRLVHEVLRVDATPTTLLIKDGVVLRSFVGPLTPMARRVALRFVEGAALSGR